MSLSKRLLGLSVVSIIVLLATASTATADDDVNPFQELMRANQLVRFGGYTRSLPHYERAIKAAPERFPIAYINYGEVLKHRGDCDKAVMIYNAYLALGNEADLVEEAREGIKECAEGKNWPKITINTSAENPIKVFINGYIASRSGSIHDMVLAPGTYTVELSATDHISRTERLVVEEGEDQTLDWPLQMMTFYGTVLIQVDQPDATLKLVPTQYKDKGDDSKVIEVALPMEKPLELETGRYFVEATKPEYYRWIRNIEVLRDNQTDLSIKMTRQLPEEIR